MGREYSVEQLSRADVPSEAAEQREARRLAVLRMYQPCWEVPGATRFFFHVVNAMLNVAGKALRPDRGPQIAQRPRGGAGRGG